MFTPTPAAVVAVCMCLPSRSNTSLQRCYRAQPTEKKIGITYRQLFHDTSQIPALGSSRVARVHPNPSPVQWPPVKHDPKTGTSRRTLPLQIVCHIAFKFRELAYHHLAARPGCAWRRTWTFLPHLQDHTCIRRSSRTVEGDPAGLKRDAVKISRPVSIRHA